MKLRSFIKENLAFLIPVFTLLITGIIFLILYPKDQIHLVQNSWHNRGQDIFFAYITLLGDGFIFLITGIILIFIKWRYFFGLLVASVLTLLIIGLLKNVVFEGEPRPVKYFEGTEQLYLVEGVKMRHWNSFPSGHTTAAFACFGFLAFITRIGILKFSTFILAALAGYSRIYLSQHFLEDVVAGTFIGTLIAFFSYRIMLYFKYSWIDDKLAPRKKIQ